MKAIPVIIIAAVLVILIRLVLRRKRSSPLSPFGWLAGVRGRKLFGETGLVAARWQFLLSAAACLACTAVVALLAARVYRAAVLQTGGRIRLRELVPTPTH